MNDPIVSTPYDSNIGIWGSIVPAPMLTWSAFRTRYGITPLPMLMWAGIGSMGRSVVRSK